MTGSPTGRRPTNPEMQELPDTKSKRAKLVMDVVAKIDREEFYASAEQAVRRIGTAAALGLPYGKMYADYNIADHDTSSDIYKRFMDADLVAAEKRILSNCAGQNTENSAPDPKGLTLEAWAEAMAYASRHRYELPEKMQVASMEEAGQSLMFEQMEVRKTDRGTVQMSDFTITENPILPSGVLAVYYSNRIEFHPLDGGSPYSVPSSTTMFVLSPMHMDESGWLTGQELRRTMLKPDLPAHDRIKHANAKGYRNRVKPGQSPYPRK